MGSDKNTYIGLFAIGLILFAWMYWSKPTEKDLARQKAVQDSIAMVHQQQEKSKPIAATTSQTEKKDTSASTQDTANHSSDSLAAIHKMQSDYGILYPALKGTDNTYILENDLLKATISARGGKIESVELKNYKTSAGGALILFTADSIRFGLLLNAYSRETSTDSLYFSMVGGATVTNKDSSVAIMQLNTGNPNKYIQFIYSLKPGTYLMQCNIRVVGMQNILASNTQDMALNWSMHGPSQEKSIPNEQRASTIYYKFYQDEVDHLSTVKDEKKTLASDISWVSFKQQFFSSILIANTKFNSPEVECKKSSAPDFVKNYAAEVYIPYSHTPDENFGMNFFLGRIIITC